MRKPSKKDIKEIKSKKYPSRMRVEVSMKKKFGQADTRRGFTLAVPAADERTGKRADEQMVG